MKMKKENTEKKSKKYLDYEDFKGFVKTMSYSQGFYGRLYEHLIYVKNNEPKQWKDIVKELEAKHFKDTLDMVLYFEC